MGPPHQATAPSRTATALRERGSILNMQKPPTPFGKMTVFTATIYTPLHENAFTTVSFISTPVQPQLPEAGFS